MLVSDGIYSRLPTIWIVLGVAFLFVGLAAGPQLNVFWGLILLGVLSISRGVQIIQSRKSILKKTQVIVLTATQRIDQAEKLKSAKTDTAIPLDVHQ